MITKNKKYQSFEEIETDLKILKLKKQIDGLYLKNNVSDLKDSLSVKNIVSSTFTNIGFSFLNPKTRWMNLIVDYAIYFLLRRKR
ncbi:MAG: DUF6327 family protein [Capnocytophaga felis]|uniref:DUF6327 family protein n=2 Tax=Capnocytophaga TaxID=1016 RepID=A0ABW8Q755_9FLAO|nr:MULTISPECIES: DUF6327 family protein [Capnocytophaga]MDO4781592.1 DUF6327 family protein [Capnocytophaga felis]GET44856.1 hypothetical protein RCZ01_01580 [Capnocytophaga felis]GET48617.1 hypothetical protein RCZ02_14480 [Capnocytophaga felis]GIJ93457.1 hypothetical protein CAPN002_06750 [Capnocytophaga stomatis]